MRNIFQVCFNTYRTECEPEISDMESVSNMKFSPRLFEVKLAQRMESVGFIQDSNMFVVSEGEAARFLNFHSGMYLCLFMMRMFSFKYKCKTASESGWFVVDIGYLT